MTYQELPPPPPPPSGYPNYDHAVPGSPYDRAIKRQQLKPTSSDLPAVLIGACAFIFIVCVLIFIVTYSTAHECSSGLVYAADPSQCGPFSLWHDLSIGGAILSVIGALTGILKR